MKAYCYLFYKLYKFWDAISIPKFWSDAKGVLTLVVLQELTALSLIVYYKTFINQNTQLLTEKWVYILTCALCFFPNFFFFYYNDNWKQIVHRYEKWPESKNNNGGVLVAVCIFAMVGNFIVACCIYKK